MDNIAFITVEDNLGTECLIPAMEQVLNTVADSSYMSIVFRERSDEYCVLRIEYDDWHDAVDLCSIITSILINEGIISFNFTYKDSRSIHE